MYELASGKRDLDYVAWQTYTRPTLDDLEFQEDFFTRADDSGDPNQE
jgi:hypothetical protein